jgi:hypothetical protein
MDVIKIGNWVVTNEGIEWRGQPEVDLLIPRSELTQLGTIERSRMYDWLVHLTSKMWLTEFDLYALNTAYIYSLEYFDYPVVSGNISFIEIFDIQQAEWRNRNR